jgi:hypothetical protein
MLILRHLKFDLGYRVGESNSLRCLKRRHTTDKVVDGKAQCPRTGGDGWAYFFANSDRITFSAPPALNHSICGSL